MFTTVEELETKLGHKDSMRYLKAKDPKTSEEEKNACSRMVIANRLAMLRYYLKRYMKHREFLQEKKCQITRTLLIKGQQTFKNSSDIELLENHLETIKDEIRQINSKLADYGDILPPVLDAYESVATDHDFAQIINANYKDVQEARADFVAEQHPGPFFNSAIFVYNVEPESSHPFMEVMLQAFRRKIAEDSRAREAVREAAEETFPEIRGMQYTATVDKQGNHVIEKYYPPLKRLK